MSEYGTECPICHAIAFLHNKVRNISRSFYLYQCWKIYLFFYFNVIIQGFVKPNL